MLGSHGITSYYQTLSPQRSNLALSVPKVMPSVAPLAGGNAVQTNVVANRFAKPVTSVDIKKAQESCVPANTKKATSWCLNV